MATPGDGRSTLLYDSTALAQVFDSMAGELAGRLHDARRVTLVGVRRRGAPLADALQARLAPMLPEVQLARLDLQIKRYADDLTLLHPDTQLTETPEQAGLDLTDRTVVLVDDVLYLGFSLNKAVQYLVSKGGSRIVTAVLVDRVCAALPVHADVTGLKLQVAPGSIVECHVPPFEPVLQIVLVQPPAA